VFAPTQVLFTGPALQLQASRASVPAFLAILPKGAAPSLGLLSQKH